MKKIHKYIDKLLDGAEVEWLPLKDIIESLKTGLNPRKNFQLNTQDAQGYYVTVREIQNGKVIFLDKTDRISNEALELINNRSNLEIGDVLFSGTGTVGRISVIKEKPNNWNIKEGVYVIKPIHQIINSQYLAHLLNSQEIVREYSKKIVGSPVISLPMKELKKLQIPIPCPDNPKKSLAIQAEIVRILDAFTALTTELTTELTIRKKQYHYYRDTLLTFSDDEAEWKPLGGLVEINTGQKPSEILDIKTDFDYINAGTTKSGYSEMSNCEGDTVTTPSRGQGGIGYVGYQQSAFWLGPLCYKMRSIDKTYFINKYLFYFLQSRHKLLLGLKKEGGVPAVNKSDLAKIQIPVPSLDEQARIVSILDKFDTLTHSISEGLPREIKLRQQQYEHYRDELLNFPKPQEV